jgi:hypothetical protein
MQGKSFMTAKYGLMQAVCVTAICLFLAPLCTHVPKSVTLQADFSAQQHWKYRMHVQINGNFLHNDSAANFSNTAQCLLTGSPVASQPSSLIFSLSNVSIASSVIDSAEILNLEKQFENLQMVYFGSSGELAPVDTATVPIVHIGGWDLYHTMARLVPALPQQAVQVGAQWERERQIPLASTVSKGIGHLYQSFRLDSLSSSAGGNQDAYLSWKFSYRIEYIGKPSSPVADDIPLLGNGTGNAIFNVTGKYLVKAEVAFKVERNKQSALGMTWSEHATLTLE